MRKNITFINKIMPLMAIFCLTGCDMVLPIKPKQNNFIFDRDGNTIEGGVIFNVDYLHEFTLTWDKIKEDDRYIPEDATEKEIEAIKVETWRGTGRNVFSFEYNKEKTGSYTYTDNDSLLDESVSYQDGEIFDQRINMLYFVFPDSNTYKTFNIVSTTMNVVCKYDYKTENGTIEKTIEYKDIFTTGSQYVRECAQLFSRPLAPFKYEGDVFSKISNRRLIFSGYAIVEITY